MMQKFVNKYTQSAIDTKSLTISNTINVDNNYCSNCFSIIILSNTWPNTLLKDIAL